jgi:hypothetical protein
MRAVQKVDLPAPSRCQQTSQIRVIVRSRRHVCAWSTDNSSQIAPKQSSLFVLEKYIPAGPCKDMLACWRLRADRGSYIP